MSEAKQISDGGPAFPQQNPNSAVEVEMGGANSHGMTLRDYFAAKAMQGILAGDRISTAHGWGTESATAYEIADAMIAVRNKQLPSPSCGDGDGKDEVEYEVRD